VLQGLGRKRASGNRAQTCFKDWGVLQRLRRKYTSRTGVQTCFKDWGANVLQGLRRKRVSKTKAQIYFKDWGANVLQGLGANVLLRLGHEKGFNKVSTNSAFGCKAQSQCAMKQVGRAPVTRTPFWTVLL